MSVLSYTTNYGFRLVDFSSVPWHDDEYANWRLVDALIASSLSIPTITGTWANSTVYAVGNRLYDAVNPNIYECQIAHTSPALPTTFLTDRTNNPGRWSLVTIGMVWKGQWVTATSYKVGDLVFQAGSTYMCKVDHVSNVFATDLTAVKWELFSQQGAAGPGSGDVNGPAASVDNRVALFDGITGKLLKDSGVLLAALALLAGPTFTGVPSAPTAAPGTNTTQLATTAFAEAIRVALINGAPASLDTLDELAAAIGDDPAFSTTMTSALALKAALASPTFTGTPAAPTAAPGTNTTQLATTAFVEAVRVALAATILPEMTAAQYRANTADKLLSTDQTWAAAEEVTLTDAATIAVDMSTFLNAKVTLAGNRVLGQPTNTKVGQCGVIRIIQDGTGTRTLTYHADWKFVGGIDPVLTTTAGATDLLFYQVIAANFIYGSLVRGIA
jgi:hypothetical protein